MTYADRLFVADLPGLAIGPNSLDNGSHDALTGFLRERREQ